MPSGGPFTFNPTFTSRLSTWAGASYPKAPPTTPTTLSVTGGITKTAGTLRGTFNPNTLTGGQIRFLWGPTSGTVSTATGATTLNGTANATGSRSLTGLACGNDYFYRAQVRNGGNTTYTSAGGVPLSFNTSNCTPPAISISSGTDPVIIPEDSLAGDFPLTLAVSIVDPPGAGTGTWSISSPAGNGTASVSGTGATKVISYAPNPNYNGDDMFTVSVTNSTSNNNKVGTYVVNVTVTDVNDPPVITEGAGPLDLSATVEDTATVHTLNATDVEMDPITWTVESGPNHGMVTFPAGTSNAKTFTYTPGQDATATGSYTVRAMSLASLDEIVINVPITPVNDSPVIVAIGAQAATEGVTLVVAQPALPPPDPDLDDLNDGLGALTWSITSPANWSALGMSISNQGVFSWAPTLGTAPTPGVFNDMYPVIIRVQDDTPGSTPDTEDFTVTVNPPDTDADMVADYNDYCPGATPSPTSTDSTNLDSDGDGTRGSDADPTDAVGGDVCDIDDDNDGMSDSFEDANGFDRFNSADASEDADGDGISNLQEFLDDTNPNAANVAIDATGYLTSFGLNLVPPLPTSIHSDATKVTAFFAKRPTDKANTAGPYRPGDNTISWRPSNGSSDDLVVDVPANVVADAPERPFFIRPLISFDVDQQVEENGAVTVTVRLNGDAPAWEATPIGSATVNYSVSGTAGNPADHSAVSGTLTFAVDDYEEDITFNVIADGVVDPNETIVFELASATNAVIGSKKTHTVTILEDNITPRASLQFTQGTVISSAYTGSPITIDARPIDANSLQTLSCDWSGTDNALLPPGIEADCVATPSWLVNTPVAGNYLIDVVVTDNGSPAKSTRVSRILHVAAGTAVTLGVADDSDMDGNFDAAEGYGDDDGDGIPAFLDAIAATNLIPDQTRDMTKALILETEPGLTLRRGTTTQAANLFGALVSDLDIARFGSVRGDAPVNSADELAHVGGIYDFEIDGLIPGTSARIVIPLQSAIPKDARYRKYNPATGWSDFVVDANNQVESATGELGACPEPGSSAYLSGLNYLDNCIQLTIQDGGLNDTDNQANGVINDPATVGVQITEPEGFEEVEDGSGGGRVSPLLLAMLLVLGGFAFRRRQRAIRID